jgi:hypothetical protein
MRREGGWRERQRQRDGEREEYSADRDSEVNWACFSPVPPPMASPFISRVHWNKGLAYSA